MGIAKNFSGMSITRVEGGALHLGCRNTIDKMEREHYDILLPYHVDMPWQSDHVISRRSKANEKLLDEDGITTYQSLVGTFNYCAMMVRPEISTIYSRLSTKQHNPNNFDMEDAIYCAAYLRGTRNTGLLYPLGCETMHVEAYTDANLGDPYDPMDISRTGVLVNIGGCLVDWSSHKQNTTLTTTRDTEYTACGDAIKMIHLLNYMQNTYELSSYAKRPTPTIHTDNEVMLKQLIKGNLPQVQRLAQFKMPIVVSAYRDRSVIFYKVHTTENPSDLLTKPTSRKTFHHLAGMMVANIRVL